MSNTMSLSNCEWKEGTLKEIAEIEMGQSPSSDTCNSSGQGIPLLNGPTEFGVKNPIAVQYTIDAKRLSRPNDILFCVRGSTTGKMNWSDKEYAIGRGLAAIRHKKGLPYRHFIRGIIDYNLELLLASATGSTFPNVSRNQLEELEILIPPIPEQTAIASIISSLDDKIDLLQRQNATLEKMAETLFRKWFVEEAKEEWEEVELGKLIDVVIDNRGKTPPTVEFKTEYPLIEVNALNSQSCVVDYTVIRKYVTKETFDTWFRKHLKTNDIIISTVGTIGVFSILLTNKGCIAQNLVGLRSSKVSSYFLYCFFKSNVETLINLDIGGVQPSIKVPHLLGLTMKLPTNDLLNTFNKSVETYFNKIATNQTQIRTLTTLRDTLLPKLMSGEVRINY
jgi:type I restriction enzyme S subunit